MEFRHLHYFIAVAEELHFGRAAEKLGIAQPPLSQQIRKLEEELGVLLFQRTKRHVELTDAGRAFFKEAQRLIEQAAQAVSAAQGAARGKRGTLALGFLGTVTYDVLPTILRVFRERFPDVEVVLREMSTPEQLEALRDRRIAIGFARIPMEPEGVVVERFLREPMVAALPETHPLAAKAQVKMADLAKVPFCMAPRTSAARLHDTVVDACRQAGFAPAIAQEAMQWHTILGLVSAGLGVSVVPASVQTFQRAGVAYRPLTDPTPWIEVGLVWRQDENSALVQEFIAVSREVARSTRKETMAMKLPSGR